MSLYNYVEPPNTNLVCCICRAPFTDPTTTRTCAHTFCYECIICALSHSPLCPVDRSPLVLEDLVPASPIVRSLVDELQVECVHRQEGCGYTCQRQMMAVHLKDECAYAEVECPVAGCREALRRREVARHVEEVHREDEDEQEQEENQEEEQEEGKEDGEEMHACPHASVGCPYKGPLKPSEHLPLCPYESLKEFFTANTAKVLLLTEQNMILRHRVDGLEGVIHTMQREMNAAKHALGPWFKSSYQATGARSLSGGAVGMGMGAMASSELPVRMQAASAGPSGLGLAGGAEEASDLFASYFPTEESMRQQQRPMMADGVYGRTAGVVAPLDLGSTLEGTLVGLRESVVGLAAGVDSVGRRGEIALTNETLRLGEELMSVRAQMHGLRMQVHGMMMDRNAVLRGEEGVRMNFGVPPSITKL